MNIRARIRERIAAGGNQAPAVISSDVIHELADDELREALSVALPYLVRDEVRKRRHDAVGRPPVRGQEQWDQMAESEPNQLPKRYDDAQKGAQRRQAARKASDAAQARRDRESVLLSTPVAVGDDWKPLGDCTAENLRTIATDHRARGDLALARAKGYERLASDLEHDGAATVRDLDAAKVRGAFDAAR